MDAVPFWNPSDYGQVLRTVRRIWGAGAVEFHVHAIRAMQRAQLTIQDIEHVIFTGSIIEHNRPSGRSWRWKIHGGCLDGHTASCVVTFERDGNLLIITVIDETPRKEE